MSDNIAERLEILVHSAASTTKKEDDRFRAQALACLEFQPAKTTPLTDIVFTKNRAWLNKKSRDGIQKLRGSQTRSQAKERREGSSQSLGTKKQLPQSSRATRSISRTTATSRGSLEISGSSLECMVAQYPRR